MVTFHATLYKTLLSYMLLKIFFISLSKTIWIGIEKKKTHLYAQWSLVRGFLKLLQYLQQSSFVEFVPLCSRQSSRRITVRKQALGKYVIINDKVSLNLM